MAQRYEVALKAAEDYGRRWPRRWLAKHGAIAPPPGPSAPAKRYNIVRREIEALIPRHIDNSYAHHSDSSYVVRLDGFS